MDKKYNTESGTLTDPKSLHQSLEVFPKQGSIQEQKFFISELPPEQLCLTFQISLVPKVLSMLSSFLTELEETWLTWLRRGLTSSQLFMMPENHKIIDF